MASNTECAPPGSGLNPIDVSLNYLLSQVTALTAYEEVNLPAALKRILAAPVTSTVNIPPWDNSAMDGYAIATQDLTLKGETRLPVSQHIPAGHVGLPLASGTAARIFTGAPIPKGVDAVVIQEQCQREGELVRFSVNVQPGDNIRRLGEAVKQGQEVLSKGLFVQPQHVGMAASVGVRTLSVVRRPKVAIFSTGDELVQPGQVLGEGAIYDSNRPTLEALLEAAGCEVLDFGHAVDDVDTITDLLGRASQVADLIISSGGVSVGEEDHVKPAVEKLGTLLLWKIAIKPGKPLAYGTVKGTPFFGVPGNPVALFVTFAVFIRPYILKMLSAQCIATPSYPLPLGFAWKNKGQRQEFVRVQCVTNADGKRYLMNYPNQSSGVLTSVVWADGLAVIPKDSVLSEGDTAEYWPFSALL
ncbi:MAG: molybdopterin molybdotransferase MoeA [Gammaproteobacteria bacterium]|nr:molybdopterin molybdotransferase MoeA [Gammaproteobacteria bacterium]